MFEKPGRVSGDKRAAKEAAVGRVGGEGLRAAREGEIWGRMPGETMRAWEAFEIYRDAGPSRTVEVVVEELARRHDGGERRFSTVKQWKTTNRWDDRAWAWDRMRDRDRMKGEASARRRLAKETEERRLKQLARHEEESLGIARELKLKALKMLQWGLEERTTTRVEVSEDGKTTHVHETVMPAKWTMRDVPMFFKVGHDLEREVLGLARASSSGSGHGRGGDASAAVSPDPDGLGDLDRQGSAEVLEGAGRRLAAFEAEQRARRLRFPRRDVPPAGLGLAAGPDPGAGSGVGGDGAAAEVEGHRGGAGSNGHGNGHGGNGHGHG
jgi:hypothetical protein